MANERKTESLVRDQLRSQNYYADEHTRVEEQKSDSPRITKRLKQASKKGSGVGYPDFIISSNLYADFLIVIECKAEVSRHESHARDRYVEYAVDGVLLYASYLSKEFDVLAIAISGQDLNDIRISHFLHLKGAPNASEWDVSHRLLSFEDYRNATLLSDFKFRQDYQALLSYSRSLNKELKSQKVTEAHRCFLISGILIALKNEAFRKSFESHRTKKELFKNLYNTIAVEFESTIHKSERIDALMQSFSFVKTLPCGKDFLIELISDIDTNINTFLRTHKYYDVIGSFYVEFLRYANNDKGLGIVLTPPHVADLFVRLAGVDTNSVVIDTCCGTAGLLIAAMKHMIKQAGADTQLQSKIKNEQIIGIEFQPNIYALAVCNMILHGDGKANISREDCFALPNQSLGAMMNKTPSVGLLNPPYKNKGIETDREELKFILNNMAYLSRDGAGRCIAIVPITCATIGDGAIGDLKRQLLERHTLEGVMSMPVELFSNSKTSVVTCIMVFTAHKPHPAGKKTWFGYWRDDGFVKTRNLGRIDLNGTWSSIRDRWIDSFVNREVESSESVMVEVGWCDEWCAEAYLPINYNSITKEDLITTAQFHFINQVASTRP